MDGPFEDPAQEAEFQGAQQVLLHPPRVQQRSITLLVSVALFVGILIARDGAKSLPDIALLVGVLFVHELGHALGMLAFGYTDVRIFFIPFFGAAAAGRRRGVARWKHGVVLLLGPVPGLVAGTVMLALDMRGLAHTAAVQLVLVNAFNLVPVAPFDGGQLFQLLVFSRHRYLELGFLAIAGLALIGIALLLKLWVIGVLGYLLLITIPIRKNVLASAETLRELDLPDDPRVLDEPQRRRLFAAMWPWMPRQWRGKPRAQAGTMEGMLEIATRKPTSPGVTAALFVAWLAGAGVSAFAVIEILEGAPAAWQTYHHTNPAFAIELPAEPEEKATGMSHVYVARRGRNREYGVVWIDLPVGAQWTDVARERLLGTGALVRDLPAHGDDREFVMRIQGVTSRVLLTARANVGFTVMVSSPDGEADTDRVIRSFRTE